MNRLAVVSLSLALLSAVLSVTGWLGSYGGWTKIAFILCLALFIVSAAAAALRTEPKE